MFAVMVPASAFTVGTSLTAYLFAGLFLAALYLAAAAKPIRLKFAATALALAAVLAAVPHVGYIVILCSEYIWC